MRTKAETLPHRAAGTWHRDCELVQVNGLLPDFELVFEKESDGGRWKATFKTIVGARLSSEECVDDALSSVLPVYGSMYVLKESPWVSELKKCGQPFCTHLQHFVLCFYDEMVEVAAEDMMLQELTM